MANRLTDKCWRNFDPWECCGQDKYCSRGCHEDGGCANGCIVPKLYAKLAKYEDVADRPEDVQKVKRAIGGEMKNYRYDLRGAFEFRIDTHPIQFMRDVLRADVVKAEPQTIGCCWFIRTHDALPVLPPFIEELPDNFQFDCEVWKELKKAE